MRIIEANIIKLNKLRTIFPYLIRNENLSIFFNAIPVPFAIIPFPIPLGFLPTNADVLPVPSVPEEMPAYPAAHP